MPGVHEMPEHAMKSRAENKSANHRFLTQPGKPGMDHRKAQKALAPLLAPLSKGYGAAMRLRAWAYAKGLKESRKPEAFCISVGNISWGGTGKTPLTGWLLDRAAQEGMKAVVLTRGYGGKTDKRPLLVTPETSPAESGDEPLMLCREHPEAAILADPNRRRAQSWAEAHLKPDLFILDDGMQHLALRRDLNLVVLSRKDLLLDWNRVIPAGTWRESAGALSRSDAFMLRAAPDSLESLPPEKLERLKSFGVPLFSFDLKPAGLVPLATPSSPSGEAARQAEALLTGAFPCALCTAVGAPESVLRSAMLLLGKELEATFTFPDHHPYALADLEKIRAGLREFANARGELPPIITTAKDAVKLEPLLPHFPELRFFVLKSEVEFGPALFTELDFPGWLGAVSRQISSA